MYTLLFIAVLVCLLCTIHIVDYDCRGLVLSQLDAGQSDEAIKTCTSAIKLARKKAPEKFRELMRIYVSMMSRLGVVCHSDKLLLLSRVC